MLGLRTVFVLAGQPQAIEGQPIRQSLHDESYSPLAYSNSLARSSKGSKFIRDQLRGRREVESELLDTVHRLCPATGFQGKIGLI